MFIKFTGKEAWFLSVNSPKLIIFFCLWLPLYVCAWILDNSAQCIRVSTCHPSCCEK